MSTESFAPVQTTLIHLLRALPRLLVLGEFVEPEVLTLLTRSLLMRCPPPLKRSWEATLWAAASFRSLEGWEALGRLRNRAGNAHKENRGNACIERTASFRPLEGCEALGRLFLKAKNQRKTHVH
eukprot:1159053-Pelagomonas_calceolata.AAC.3